MTEESSNRADNLHKRLSLMENEINELNEILQENLENSNKNKINYLSSEENGANTNDHIDQEIDDLKNVIINDKLDFLDDLDKSKTPPLEQKEHQKVNKNWAVYTNQEGRRIHEIPVKQKIKELEQNPSSLSNDVNYIKSPLKTNYSSSNNEDHKVSPSTPESSNSKIPEEIAECEEVQSPKAEKIESPTTKEVQSPKAIEIQSSKVEETKSLKAMEDDVADHIETKEPVNSLSEKVTDTLVIEDHIPKTVTPPKIPIQDYKLASTTKTKNPFRVVSVSKSKETSPVLVKSPIVSDEEPDTPKQKFIEKVEKEETNVPYEETPIPNDVDILLKLYDHICEKINKLSNEIDYVTNIIESRYSYSLTYDELKQFKKGKVILQRYLDKKYKQKYELENKISLKFRQLKLDDKMNSKLFFGNK